MARVLVELVRSRLAELAEAVERLGRGRGPRLGPASELLRRHARLDEVARAPERRAEARLGAGPRSELLVGEGAEGVHGQAVEAGLVEVDVAAGEIELVEVGAYGLRRDPQLAQARDGGSALALRELAAVVSHQEPVVDVLGRLGPERARDLNLELRARQEVLAADDVCDPEVEIVDDGGELVGRPAVGADERGASEAQGALGVGGSDLARGLQMPLGSVALPERPLVPADPEPLEVAEDLLLGPGTARATSVSSIRRTRTPPRSSANRRLITAVSAPPRCSEPVGLGAKRTRATGC